MSYGACHQYLLRSVAGGSVLSTSEARQIVDKFDEFQNVPIEDIVKDINVKIKPYQQAIKYTNDELTNEEVLVFLSLGFDEATKSQNLFLANELEYFRVLIEQIMTTETRQITGIHAMNLVSNVKPTLTKTDAEKILNTWCRMRYLDKDGNNYALGVRAIHEFESYLRENMPDTIEECCLCKSIVFRGCNCPGCAVAVHTRCLNRYIEKMGKWPCCKADFHPGQLERLNSDESSRLSQRLEQTRINANNDMTEQISHETEATQEESEQMINTQDIIPEISQRITRKRKRHIE